MADIYIGNVKGPQGDTGATGPQGAAGAAATVQVGTVSTTAYGNPAQVTNSGTEHAAVLNFTIPQGAPGATVTQLDNLALNTITTSTDQYPQIQVGDLGRVIFGKIIKFFQDLVTSLAAKINYSDALTMEEIEAASDLTDKVSAAAASKTLKESLSTNDYYKADGFTNSTSYGTVTGMRIRSGKTVYLSFEVTLTAALSSAALLTVPVGYRPTITTGSMLAVYINTSNAVYVYSRTLQINTSGEVIQQISGTMPSGAKLFGFFTYRTNDAEPS